mgnify:CR=1 FL=1
MQSQTDTLENREALENLAHRLRRWDEDMRFGCRGLEQLTRVLREARAPEPALPSEFSSDDLAEILCPERLAEFRMLARALLEHIPGLLAELAEFESSSVFVARHS